MKELNYGEIAVQSVSPIKALQQLNRKYEGVTRIYIYIYISYIARN